MDRSQARSSPRPAATAYLGSRSSASSQGPHRGSESLHFGGTSVGEAGCGGWAGRRAAVRVMAVTSGQVHSHTSQAGASSPRKRVFLRQETSLRRDGIKRSANVASAPPWEGPRSPWKDGSRARKECRHDHRPRSCWAGAKFTSATARPPVLRLPGAPPATQCMCLSMQALDLMAL